MHLDIILSLRTIADISSMAPTFGRDQLSNLTDADYESDRRLKITDIYTASSEIDDMQNDCDTEDVDYLYYSLQGLRGPENANPQLNSISRTTELPGVGHVFLGFPAPAPGPAHSPDTSPLKHVWRNGTIYGMSGGSPWTGVGRGSPPKQPPWPVVRVGPGM